MVFLKSRSFQFENRVGKLSILIYTINQQKIQIFVIIGKIQSGHHILRSEIGEKKTDILRSKPANLFQICHV